MRNSLTPLLLLTALLAAGSQALAAKSTPEEARVLAQEWVSTIVAKQGAWAGSIAPEVAIPEPFERNGRLLGYFCPVKPKGYVIVSLYKQLAAVKAWTDTNDLDPASDEAMVDLLKGGLERMIDGVEAKAGKKIDATSEDEIGKLVDIDYRKAWQKPKLDSSAVAEQAPPPAVAANYSSGGVLLTTCWHQFWPYNDQCPVIGCTDPALNSRALVGCVATAGAQIMNYWHWPPNYTWTDIPDELTAGSTTTQIAETSRLCHDVGVAVGMAYGCDGSSAATSDMTFVYIGWSYSGSGADSTCHVEYRPSWSVDNWFLIIQQQLNVNRPLQYRIPGHSVVCDGWRIDNDVKQYHIVYGWTGGSRTTWYTVDAIAGGNPGDEYIVTDIVPANCIKGTVAGNYYYNASFPYRYFDRDATGNSAYFDPGQLLQFLQGVTVTCPSTDGSSIKFWGTSAGETRMFTRGDQASGIKLMNCCLKLTNGGTLRLP